jgi:DNA topoisomerase-1
MASAGEETAVMQGRNGSASGRTRQDPRVIADQAGLRYVSDSMPGITRRKNGTGFTYRDPDGQTIRDPKLRRRLNDLVIPPAWTSVWICPDPDGHLQVTGRDDRGRKQYRYHPRWREMQDHSKFGRMIVFGMSLPRMRERIEQDLAQNGLPRTRVLAAALRILDTTPIRVGNERYMRDNGSFGLTTMRNRHVDLSDGLIRFRFRGKSGKDHVVGLADPDVARVIRKCTETPGSELFTYRTDDGSYCSIDSEALNEYIQELSGYDFTAKDFRTWAGTVRTVTVLNELGPSENARERKKKAMQGVKFVAADLGNTPATCRSYYIHPGVLDAYDRGKLLPLLSEIGLDEPPQSAAGLREEEWPVLALLPRLDALALLEEIAIDDDLGTTLRESLEEAQRKAS